MKAPEEMATRKDSPSVEKGLLKDFVTTRSVFRQQLLSRLQPCRKIVPLISQSMDRQLKLREWLQMKLHLLICSWCVRYKKQITFLRQILRQQERSCSSIASTAGLNDAARDRINQSIRSND